MTPDSPLAEFEVASGAQRGSRLILYANRVVHQGADAMEAVPLAHLASVRVGYERDARKLNRAVALLLAALVLAVIAGPLQNWLAGAALRIGGGRRESLDALLQGVLGALGGVASILPGLAAALAAAAAALLVFYWLGASVLTFAFAATERSYAVRGRNPYMVDFAHAVAEQLAARRN